MPPTLPPQSSWSGVWAPRDRDHWQFALHASRPLAPEELHRLIRLNAALGRAALVLSRPSAWPPVRQPLYDVDLASLLHPELDTPPRPTAHPPQPWWESWLPVGAILLTLLLLIGRATERCLRGRLKRRRAQRAEEWSTPNVRATSNRDPSEPVAPPYSSVPTQPSNRINITVDMPPPYTECATTSTANNDAPQAAGAGPPRGRRKRSFRRIEEPPPPYSACFVTYSNPKQGVPAVHFYNPRRGYLPSMMANRMTYVMDNVVNRSYLLENNIMGMSTRLNARNDEMLHAGYRVGRDGTATDIGATYYDETPENERVYENVNINDPLCNANDNFGQVYNDNESGLHLREQRSVAGYNGSSSNSVTPKTNRRTIVIDFRPPEQPHCSMNSVIRDLDLEEMSNMAQDSDEDDEMMTNNNGCRLSMTQSINIDSPTDINVRLANMTLGEAPGCDEIDVNINGLERNYDRTSVLTLTPSETDFAYGDLRNDDERFHGFTQAGMVRNDLTDQVNQLSFENDEVGDTANGGFDNEHGSTDLARGNDRVSSITNSSVDLDEDEKFDELVIKALDDAEAQIRGDINLNTMV